MKKTLILAAPVFASMILGCVKFSGGIDSASTTIPELAYLRGVNVIDLQQGTMPGTFGTDYTSPTLANLQYIKSRGSQLVRLPIAWERVQPTLGAALDSAYVGRILQALRDADTAGLRVILDLHAYGRYNSVPFGGPSGPTRLQYADLWTRLSGAIKADASAHKAIYAYDIMNEPHDLVAEAPTLQNPQIFENFEGGIPGWSTQDSASAVAGETRAGQGSIHISRSTPSGANGRYSARKTGAVLDDVNGHDLEATVFVPNTTSGSIAAFIVVYGTGYQWNQSSAQAVPKGVATKIQYSVPPGLLNQSPAYQIVFEVNGASGSSPMDFYVDDIQQGTFNGGTTGDKVWESFSQVAVDAIRLQDTISNIMVEGSNWASANYFAATHPLPWITDPSNKIIYHAHQYADDNASGVYSNSFATEQTNAINQNFTSVADRYVKRLKNFGDWTRQHNVRGFIGEMGWPNTDAVGATDAANWNAVGEAAFAYLDSINMGATIWMTGSWIGPNTNIMGVYSFSGTPTPLSPSAVFESHILR